LKKKEQKLDLYGYSLKYFDLFENRRFEKFFALFFEYRMWFEDLISRHQRRDVLVLRSMIGERGLILKIYLFWEGEAIIVERLIIVMGGANFIV
jgi:hypothetical protein